MNEKHRMSERNTAETLEGIKNTYPDFDVNVIDEIVVSNITVTAKKDGASVDEKLNIIMSKEGGTWKLLYID